MGLLFILTCGAVAYAVFRIFKIPVNGFTLLAAALGGAALLAGLLLGMNYNHPFTSEVRFYFNTTPIVSTVSGRVVEVVARPNTPVRRSIRSPTTFTLIWAAVSALTAAGKVAKNRPVFKNDAHQNFIKIGRNDPCHCGSGKKYKNCHWGEKEEVSIPKTPSARPEVSNREDLDPAQADVMSPEYWERMSKRLPHGMRKEFDPMLAAARQHAELGERWERIELAVQALETNRAEYEKLAKKPYEFLLRAESLFAEEPFADMRFSAADVGRAFATVGYPPPGVMDEHFIRIVDKALRFLLDDDQIKQMAQRLLFSLPDYVDAGRYLDGWIIWNSAGVMLEPHDGPMGSFLLVMFMHGFKQWGDHRDREERAMFEELGVSPEKIRRMGYKGVEAWLRDTMGDPSKTAAMNAFLAKHPELNAATEAHCRAAGEAAEKLLQRDDARCLLLASTDVQPWLNVLDRRVRETPEISAALSEGVPHDEAIASAFAKLVHEVASNMAKSVFTPERLDRLRAQLHEMRRGLSAEKNKEKLAGVHGALIAAQDTTAPEDQHFLVAICWASLLDALKALEPHSTNDLDV